jgi:hypothetical protein
MKMPMISQCTLRIVAWCALSWFLLCGPSVSAAEYEVEGEIVQTIFNRDGGIRSLQRSKFTVFVRDCAWLIKTLDHTESGIPLITRETACTNGTEVCEVEGPFNKESWKYGVMHYNLGVIIHKWLDVLSKCDEP